MTKWDKGELVTAAYNRAWADPAVVPLEKVGEWGAVGWESPACASGAELAGTQLGSHRPGRMLRGNTLISILSSQF